ncbi:MAG: hypothetical protein KF861_03360 [Planctomycetaceae bacterium]|nr:hypothetical protein [Planctomycetaceae bacterium]
MTEPTPSLPPVAGSSPRILSLDQFRGYTVAGMFLVNYIGTFKDAVPMILLHSHDYCSYADTIMPQFLFAVGFSFRLTFGRRAQRDGLGVAYRHMVRRILGLMLIAIVVYGSSRVGASWNELVEMGWRDALVKILGPNMKRNWYQTLMHIAFTSLWLLPVIRASGKVRFVWMLASAVAHVWLSYKFNFVWVNTDPNGIDGGPLGFLTWTVPAMFGTFACDVVAGAQGRPQLGRLMWWGFVLMALAWIMSCGTRMYDVPSDKVEELKAQKLADDPVFPSWEHVKAHFQKSWPELLAEPPFVPPPNSRVEVSPGSEGVWPRYEDRSDWYRKWNYWMMSQRGGTLTYPMFSAGVALWIYVLFYVLCDIWGFRSTFFNAFGVNALAAYILHDLVGGAVKPLVPQGAPTWYIWGSVAVFFVINYVIIRHLEKQKIFLKL